MYDICCMVCTGELYLIGICFLLHKCMCYSMLLTPLSQPLMYPSLRVKDIVTYSHGFIGIASHTIYCYQQCVFPVKCTDGKRF